MNSKQVKEFLNAMDAIVAEKGIDKSVVVEAMEQAMVAAFRKKTGNPNGKCYVDEETGQIRLCSFKTVVEEVNDERLEISLEDAKKMEESFDYQSMIETLLKNIKTISVTDVKKETFQDLL